MIQGIGYRIQDAFFVIPAFSFVVIPVQTGIQEDLEVRNHLRG